MNFQISINNGGSHNVDYSTVHEAQQIDQILNQSLESDSQEQGRLNYFIQSYSQYENLYQNQYISIYQEPRDSEASRRLTNRGHVIIYNPGARKEYSCKFCGKKFTKHQSLGGHLQKKYKLQDKLHKKE